MGMRSNLHKHIRFLYGFFIKLRALNRSDNGLADGLELVT